jgi:hypothetical protein
VVAINSRVGKIAYGGVLWFVLVTKCYVGNKIIECEIGGIYNTQGGEEKRMQDFGRGDCLEDLGIDGRITLK